MGCAQTKGRVDTAAAAAAATSGQAAEASEAERAKLKAGDSQGVDPKLGLNEREVFKLKTSWKAVHRRVGETGVEMFISLFRSNKELQAMFIKFSNVELTDNVRDNGELETHGELVMGVLDEAIVNIENIQQVKDRVGRAAAHHRQFAGFYGKLFWSMEQPFLDAVRITLEDRFNDTIADIYARTIRYILQEMEEAFDQAG